MLAAIMFFVRRIYVKKMLKLSCEALLAGDPKCRTYRAVYNETFLDFSTLSRKEQKQRDKLIRATE